MLCKTRNLFYSRRSETAQIRASAGLVPIRVGMRNLPWPLSNVWWPPTNQTLTSLWSSDSVPPSSHGLPILCISSASKFQCSIIKSRAYPNPRWRPFNLSYLQRFYFWIMPHSKVHHLSLGKQNWTWNTRKMRTLRRRSVPKTNQDESSRPPLVATANPSSLSFPPASALGSQGQQGEARYIDREKDDSHVAGPRADSQQL